MINSEQIIEDYYKFFRFVESLAPHIAKALKAGRGMTEVCCNCKHNIRTGEAPDIKCHCELDGSFIGYVKCMEYRCEHWEGEND